MAVEVRLPTVLREHAGGQSAVRADGSTVGEVLRALAHDYPALAGQLAVTTELPRFLNVYLNDEDVRYLQKLDTLVGDSDVIQIMPAVAGG